MASGYVYASPYYDSAPVSALNGMALASRSLSIVSRNKYSLRRLSNRHACSSRYFGMCFVEI